MNLREPSRDNRDLDNSMHSSTPRSKGVSFGGFGTPKSNSNLLTPNYNGNNGAGGPTKSLFSKVNNNSNRKISASPAHGFYKNEVDSPISSPGGNNTRRLSRPKAPSLSIE